MSPTDIHSEAIRRFFSEERGTLVLIGGNESKTDEMGPLKKFLDISGGKKAKIAIIPTASRNPIPDGEEYVKAFEDFGVSEAILVDVSTRDKANNPKNRKIIEDSTGVYFMGGSQLRISSILGGTITFYSIVDHYNNGGTVGGTSAGSSAMSSTMIKSGRGDEGFIKGYLHFGPGLGFLPNIIIDTHFTKRARMGRLIHAVTENPGMIGVGIDENTGIVITSNGILTVYGEKTATIVDGHLIKDSNVYDAEEGETISVSPIKIHIISEKHSYDIVKCRFIPH